MNYGKINAALWIFWLLYWIVSARGTKKTLQRGDQGRRFVAFIFVIFIGWGIYHSRNRELNLRILPDTVPLQQLGTVCCAAGVLFAIWARRILGANWSAAPTIKENHELVTAGPYEFVRHPIYTGLLLALFGSVVLARGRVRDLVAFALAVVLLWMKLKIEERLMKTAFPDTYPAYKRRTKALIPFFF